MAEKTHIILGGYLGDDKPGKPHYILAQEVLEASGLPPENCILASSGSQLRKHEIEGKIIVRPSDVLRRKA